MTHRLYTCDLDVLKSLSSCRDDFSDGRGNYCAQGKLGKACGIDPHTDRDYFLSFLEFLGRKPVSDGGIGFKFNQVAQLNNDGEFEKADALMLQIAMQSGKLNFKGGIQEKHDHPSDSPLHNVERAESEPRDVQRHEDHQYQRHEPRQSVRGR